jgi:hypothetical protein
MFTEVVAVLPLVAGDDTDALRALVCLCFTCKEFAPLLAEQLGHFSVLRHWCSCLHEWHARQQRLLVAHVAENGERVRAAVHDWWGPNGARRNGPFDGDRPFDGDLQAVLVAAEAACNCDAEMAIRVDNALLQEVNSFAKKPTYILLVLPVYTQNDDDSEDEDYHNTEMVAHLKARRRTRRRFMGFVISEEHRVRMIEMFRNAHA